MKKGQVTIFIMIGIIIIIILIVSLLFLKNRNDLGENLSDTYHITNYVESCLSDSLVSSLKFFGTQGIIYNNSNIYRNLSYFNIPYFYYLGENRLPSLKETEEILAIYSEGYFDECMNDFKETNDYRVEFNEDKELMVKINKDYVSTSLRYPIIITKGDFTSNIERFEAEINFNFEEIYNVTNKFIMKHYKYPNFIPIGYMSVLSYEENIEIQYSYLTHDSLIYVFIFNNLKLNDEPYVLSFGVRYNFSSLYEDGNKTEN